MDEILKYLVPSLSLSLLVSLLFLLNPEKVEKWSALLWKLLAMFGILFRSAHKQYIKHDLQGRVNEFVKLLQRQVPGVGTAKLKIEWVDPATPRKSFIEQDQVVLRLRRDDQADCNFIHGAYLFVSESLLKKPKRYISPSQREALDLYVCTKLLETEKPAVVTLFLDEYLHPKTDDQKSKVATYVDDFAVIDKGGLFFPIFIQELEHLGDKVFGRRRDSLVIKEVDGLITFLKPIANRTVGDDNGDLDFDGTYCRFAIMIVGKPMKLLTSIEPYVRYISNVLIKNNTEAIYILARFENEKRVEDICSRFSKEYDCMRRVKFSKFLKYTDRSELVLQYLVVMKKRGAPVIQASS